MQKCACPDTRPNFGGQPAPILAGNVAQFPAIPRKPPLATLANHARVRRQLFHSTDSMACPMDSIDEAQSAHNETAGQKRRRLTPGNDDAVLDNTQLARDREMAEMIFKEAIAVQQANGCVWPNGCAGPMQALAEQFPNYYWVIIRHQGNNFNIAQPASDVYVMIMADFLAFGYCRD
jgi:hypothetical protein